MTEHDSDLDDFMMTYLRQLARTGRVADRPRADAPVWHVEERPEGQWAVVRGEVEAAGVEEARFGSRQDAYTAAAMLTAVASEPDNPELERRLEAGEPGNPEVSKEVLGRILRGLTRNPAAMELFLQGLPDESVRDAYDALMKQMSAEGEN